MAEQARRFLLLEALPKTLGAGFSRRGPRAKREPDKGEVSRKGAHFSTKMPLRGTRRLKPAAYKGLDE
jgi:hypothetical protein